MSFVVMPKTDWQGILNSVRAKTGKPDLLVSSNVSAEIESIQATDIIQHANIPDYVKNETLRVIDLVESVRMDDSIVFVATSDNHHYGIQADTDTNPDKNGIQTSTSNLHAAMAMKIMAYALKFDFMAHLGDATWGHKTTTSDLLHSQIEEMMNWLRESHLGIPCFHAIGNHDAGIYYHNDQNDAGNTGVFTESAEYLYNKFTALSASENTVFGGIENGGYCYRDFPEKKLRVFLLNSSEKITAVQKDQCMYGSQRVWFANALLDLNDKSDANKWGFIVLCHYPADYGGNMALSELLKAYVEGNSFTITDPTTSYYVGDGTNHSVSFVGKNNAKFIAQFHGHIHNFLASKLYSYATGKGVQYDAWRISIPNGQFNRENYYSTVGSYTDINFKEDTSYLKTANTAQDTSFVVNVINPSEEKIYSFCYGAGKDRVIGYAATTYHTIRYNLSNVTVSNTGISIEEGKNYICELTAVDGYELNSVAVTMGGIDITNDVYLDGVISIANVTGDISITAIAVEILDVVNQLPISTDVDGSVYNGNGYSENTYLSAGSVGSRDGIYTSGFIPVPTGDGFTLYFKNCGLQLEQSNHRFSFFDENKSHITNSTNNTTSTQLGGNTSVEWTVEDGYVVKAYMHHSYAKQASFFRFCCSYLGPDSIVTVNEPIEEEVVKTYTITNKLNNVTSSNSISSIAAGERYTTTIIPNDNYVIDAVYVKMNGIDVSDDCTYYDGDNKVIDIQNVTGDIEIEARGMPCFTVTYNLTNVVSDNTQTKFIDAFQDFEANLTPFDGYRISSVTVFTDENVDITADCVSEDKSRIFIAGNTENLIITAIAEVIPVNLLPTAQDVDGSIYNGVGYKADTYISSSSGNASSSTGKYATGFIRLPEIDPATIGPGETGKVIIYFENIIIPDTADTRIVLYPEDKTSGFVMRMDNNTPFVNDANAISYGDILQYVDASGNITALDITEFVRYAYNVTSNVDAKWFRISSETTMTSESAIYINTLPSDDNQPEVPAVNNLLLTSTDASGNVYNSKGYKENTYLSGGSEGTASGIYASGYIPIPATTGLTRYLYFKNVGMKIGQDKHRVSFFNTDKSYTGSIFKTTSDTTNFIWFGDDGNITKMALTVSKIPDGGFIRICGDYLGDDSIVSNEPIE